MVGRPKAIEKRDRQVNVALTTREYELIRTKADAVGLTLTNFARAALLRRSVAVEAIQAISTTDRLTVEALKRIGSNINQIARHMNTHNAPPPADLAPLLSDIRAIVAKVDGHGS